MSKRFQFTHYHGDNEIELRVTYSMTAALPARLYGDYPHPAEDSLVELISVEHDGREFPLTQDEEAVILEAAIDRSADDWADDVAAAEEWRADQRRDDLLMEKWEQSQ